MQAQYLPHNGELSALIKQNHFRMKVEGHSRSVIQDCGCVLREVSFKVLPKRCNRRTISYMERERVPKDRGIVTEGIRKVFKLICKLYDQKWGLEGT